MLILTSPFKQSGPDLGSYKPLTGGWSTTRKGPNVDLYTDANTIQAWTHDQSWQSVAGEVTKSTGKWFWELDNMSANGFSGIARSDANLTSIASYPALTAVIRNYTAESRANSWPGVIVTSILNQSGSIYGYALDMDNKALYISRNGVWLCGGNPHSGVLKTGCVFSNFGNVAVGPVLCAYGAGANINAGQFPFRYGI